MPTELPPPPSEGGPEFARARLAYRRGIAALRASRFREAVLHFDYAHRLAPERDDITRQLALAHYKCGNSRAASPLLEKLLSKNPRDYTCALRLGECLISERQLPHAVAMLCHAMTLRPGNLEPALPLGVALLRMGKTRRADKLLTQVVLEYPHEPVALQHLAFIRYYQGRHQDAMALTQRVMIAHPRQWPAWDIFGRAAYACGRLDAAADAFREVVRLRPNSPEAFARLQVVERAMRVAEA